jgi:hypothetical protein
LPKTPTTGNPHDGYSAKFEDGSNVEVKQSADGIIRSISLDGVDLALETETQQIDLSKHQAEYNETMQEL